MDSSEVPPVALALARRMREGMTAAQVASEVAQTWRRVEESLSPIIGPAGVAAIYKRSVSLASKAHPWLAPLSGQMQQAVDVEALKATLAGTHSDDAALGGGELLGSFYGVLLSLIGPTLTRRLLSFMWHS